MDRFGRKVTVLVFSLPFLLGWATICSAHFLKPNGFFLLYIGRIITGIENLLQKFFVSLEIKVDFLKHFGLHFGRHVCRLLPRRDPSICERMFN